jgi:hypothetical protein
MTKPAEMNLPIKEIHRPFWRHKDSLETIPSGYTPVRGEQEGYVRLSSEQAKHVDGLKSARVIIERIGEKMKEVFPPTGGIMERMTGGAWRVGGAVTQANEAAAELHSYIQGLVVPLVKALARDGQISNIEGNRIVALLPKISDSANVAWKKYANVLYTYDQIPKRVMRGIDVKAPPKGGATEKVLREQGEVQPGPKKKFELVK